MPKAGNDMEEGMLIRWAVSEGDRVKVGAVLFEIETDKATLEVESEFEGTLRRIVVKEGETVPVHTPVAYLADSDAALEAFLAALGGALVAKASGAAQAVAPAPEAKPERMAAVLPAGVAGAAQVHIKASPAARKMAAERGMDLASLAGTGSGPGGRILSGDLPIADCGLRIPQSSILNPQSPILNPQLADPKGTTRSPMKPMRRAIARSLTHSIQTAPHFFMKLTVNAERLREMYKAQKKICKATFNDLLVAATGRVMAHFPAFRSQVHGEELLEFASSNIGIAVAVEDGLRVPVVMGVDKMTLAQLAQETKRVIQEARNGKSANAGKGTFTISNLGMTGVEEFTAIINPPEAAILAVGRLVDSVCVHKGEIQPARMLSMWLSSDHRVVDGITAARFLAELKQILEAPEVLERNEK
jgi:pyruvate dehydrogenase E2 component (dihydrolipoamide acetyltransferase)